MMRKTRWVTGLVVLGLASVWSGPQFLAQEKKEKGKGKVAAKTLPIGAKAPAFENLDDQGKLWKSTDVVGKKNLVLFFFPAALTGG